MHHEGMVSCPVVNGRVVRRRRRYRRRIVGAARSTAAQRRDAAVVDMAGVALGPGDGRSQLIWTRSENAFRNSQHVAPVTHHRLNIN